MSEGLDLKGIDAELKRREEERQRALETEAEGDILISQKPESEESETTPRDEGTPKEWREKLRGLITSAKEKLGMSERGERMQSYLAERSQGLQEKAKGLGPVPEKLLRSLGETYNKLNWKYKLAISAGLIAGVGFSAVGSIPALIAGYGLVAQRGVGLAGMYAKFEKHLQKTSEGKADGYWAKKEWYKKLAEKPGWQRKAMAGVMAAGYTGLMGFGIHEAIGVIRGDESWGGQLHEWVKSHWPLGSSAGVHPDVIPAHPAESLSTESTATPQAETPTPAPDADAGSATEAPTHDGEVPSSPEPENLQPAHEGSPVSPESEVETGTPAETSTPTESVGAENTDVVPAPEGSHEGSPVSPEPETAPEAADADAGSTETTATIDELTRQQAEKELAELSAEDAATPSVPEVSHEGSPVSFESQTTPEASAAPAPTEEVVTAHDAVSTDTPVPEHLTVNAHGLSIDTAHASAYLDSQGKHFIYGGTMDERFQEASKLVARDHSDVYFESTREKGFFDELFNRKIEPLTTKLSWVESDGGTIKIEELNNLPSGINDLAQVYKPETGVDVTQLRPAEMPITAPNPEDISRAEMPQANTGDGLNRPEMQLGKQNIPHGPEISTHPFGHVESGSVKGEFGYSPDGSVTSFQIEGISHGEFAKTVLTDNYREVLLNRPGNHSLTISAVENRARDLFNRMQVLDELAKRGASESPEADFIRKGIKFTVEQTEKAYGHVFKDMHISPPSGSLRDE